MKVNMNDWSDLEAKLAAKKEFCKRLSKDPSLRGRCIEDKQEARKTFAGCGHFYLAEDPSLPANINPVPLDTEFRVFEGGDLESKEKLVTIVLRDRQTSEAVRAEMPDPARVWMCSWFPYPPGPPVED
ncbi:MAG TPA: hypothetical protein VGG02_09990 [Chthoniobacterales bacterium]|jgi:hypothetical protein